VAVHTIVVLPRGKISVKNFPSERTPLYIKDEEQLSDAVGFVSVTIAPQTPKSTS